jgi:hypothetical protein
MQVSGNGMFASDCRRITVPRRTHTSTHRNRSGSRTCEPRLTYPGTRDKADIAVNEPESSAIFELKSFVRFADANKMAKFPQQIRRVESLVLSKTVAEGVAFCTFFGYTADRVQRLCKGFFSPPWNTTPVRPLREGKPLLFMFASVRSF